MIIGMASGYSDEQLRPFMESADRLRLPYALIRSNPLPEHPIVSRFKLISELLAGKEGLVIACDTRDVVFKSDPFTWLERHLGNYSLCVVSEGIKFKDSPGNAKNVTEAFGQKEYAYLAEKEVLNAGVIAGYAHAVRLLCGRIYDLCLKDKRKNVTGTEWDNMCPDQSALNLIVYNNYDDVLIATEADHFVFEKNHRGDGSKAAIWHRD